MKTGAKLFEQLDSISDTLPKSGEQLTLSDTGQWFGDKMEKMGISLTGAAGCASVLFNLVLATYYGGYKALVNKLTGEESGKMLRPFRKWAQKAMVKAKQKQEREMGKESGDSRQGEELIPMIGQPPDRWPDVNEIRTIGDDLPSLNRLMISTRTTPTGSRHNLNVSAPPYASRDPINRADFRMFH